MPTPITWSLVPPAAPAAPAPETPTAYDASQYATQLMDLLPQGRLWNPEADSKLRGVLLAIGEELARVDDRGLDLIDESDPRTASETIEQWESMLSLPDERVTAIPATLAERQIAITQKYTERGGQSVQFFIDLALACGYVLLTQGLDAPAIFDSGFLSTGGTLADGDYWYRVTALNGDGESAASESFRATVDPGTATNVATIEWAAVEGATGYRIYGNVLGSEGLLDEVGAAVLTYEDDGLTLAGAAFPEEATEPITKFADQMLRAGFRCGDRVYADEYAYAMQLNVMPIVGTVLPLADFERVIRHVVHSHITTIFNYT